LNIIIIVIIITCSAQSSQSTTPVHEPHDGRSASSRFYVATPDLLSSDTDVTSPDNHVSAAVLARSSGGASAENGPPSLATPQHAKHPADDDCQMANHRDADDDPRPANSVSSPPPHQQPRPTTQAVADHGPPPPPLGRSAVPDRPETDDDGSRPADSSRAPPGFRFRATDPSPDHQRDSSPINRLAGLFKNLARF